MKIKIITNKKLIDFKNCSIWECPPSTFDWKYEQEEHCFIIEGRVSVIGSVNTVHIHPGDYVIFPKGLKCHWKVIKPVRKHYSFG